MSAALVIGILVAVNGCTVSPDAEPRDIDSEEMDQLPLSPDAGGAAATGAGRIYLIVPGATAPTSRLRAVSRDVGDDASALLQALLAGPNSEERADQFRTALVPGQRLNDARRLAAGVLLVDVSDEITELSGDELILAVAQIVFTANELADVRAVELAVDGVSGQWPAGNGELRAEPLTVYDYPGLEPSTQPAYPGLPG